MTETNPTLLPSGFYDLLPPFARKQRLLVQQVIEAMESFGYQQVTPPLMEFESSLLNGNAAALSHQSFRVMDPLSREMMGIRPDMTLQVARIATHRLASESRPLRLCYTGTCLQVTGEGLRRERQLVQAGAELIGHDSLNAECEILRCAIASLAPLDLGDITIDISLPKLAHILVQSVEENDQATLLQALIRKDKSVISALDISFKQALLELVESQNAQDDLARWKIASAQLPPEAAELLYEWLKRCETFLEANLDAKISFDPLEGEGFEYHEAFAFSIFSNHVDTEIGRGGRYHLNASHTEKAEIAVGFSLYLSAICHELPEPEAPLKCYVTAEGSAAESARLRQKGWVTLHALETDEQPEKTARENRCTHLLDKGTLIPLQEAK